MSFEEYEAQLDDAGPSIDLDFDTNDNNDNGDNAAEQGLMQALRARLGV